MTGTITNSFENRSNSGTWDPDSEIVMDACAVAIELEERGETKSAIAVYEICVLIGNLTAKTRLADLLSEPPEFLDVARAKSLYHEACMQGFGAACTNLSVLYSQLGNTELAKRYMKAAKDRGDLWDEGEP